MLNRKNLWALAVLFGCLVAEGCQYEAPKNGVPIQPGDYTKSPGGQRPDNPNKSGPQTPPSNP